MYAKGMSQRDIEDTLRDIYGSEVSQSLISRITDKIFQEVNEWQNRPLDKIYPVVFFDGIVFNSRKDNKIVSKCVYAVLGINMAGMKEILGTWISENESASFYASICSDLKNRGVILTISKGKEKDHISKWYVVFLYPVWQLPYLSLLVNTVL